MKKNDSGVVELTTEGSRSLHGEVVDWAVKAVKNGEEIERLKAIIGYLSFHVRPASKQICAEISRHFEIPEEEVERLLNDCVGMFGKKAKPLSLR